MSSLIYRGKVIDRGAIVETDTEWTGTAITIKAQFPDAYITPLEPQGEGDWFFDGIRFVNLEEQRTTHLQIQVAHKESVDENERERVREKRNELLAETDWTQGRDISDAVASKWAVYRQALRDIPEQEGFPWDVQWPIKPE